MARADREWISGYASGTRLKAVAGRADGSVMPTPTPDSGDGWSGPWVPGLEPPPPPGPLPGPPARSSARPPARPWNRRGRRAPLHGPAAPDRPTGPAWSPAPARAGRRPRQAMGSPVPTPWPAHDRRLCWAARRGWATTGARTRPPRSRVAGADRPGRVRRVHRDPGRDSHRAVHLRPAGRDARSAPQPPPVRGTWLAVLNYRSSSTVDTVHVTSDDRTTGVFAGTVDSAGGDGSITGKVTGYAVRFTISIGLGAESATATVTSDGRTTTINGDFANATGGSGTITATRVSCRGALDRRVVPVGPAPWVSAALGSRPGRRSGYPVNHLDHGEDRPGRVRQHGEAAGWDVHGGEQAGAPPSSVAHATAASQSSTAKYTSQ